MALVRNTDWSSTGPVLEGKGVYLRYPQTADYAAWAELRGDSRAFLAPWEPIWPSDDLTRPAFRRRVKRYANDIKDDQAYPFFLFRAEDDALAGGATFSNVRRGVAQTCSLGYWVGANFARKGLMTAGVKALLPFVFDTLKLHRIEAACLPANEASQRLLKRIGFRKEGYAEKYLKINGEWQDHVVYAMLNTDSRPTVARALAEERSQSSFEAEMDEAVAQSSQLTAKSSS